MSDALQYTMFQDVFFPSDNGDADGTNFARNLLLAKELRYQPLMNTKIRETSIVIFDFETTGLRAETDRIIEIGGLKITRGRPMQEFQTLVKVPMSLSQEITKITGITDEMLTDCPTIEEVLKDFLSFIDGSIIAAHNADFDMAVLTAECTRLGIQIDWPCFCTLKLSRALLPDLNSRSLDNLAAHYGLTFEARHRSIGDCKVTYEVFKKLLDNEGVELASWSDFQPFSVVIGK
jgi:DNA polymerase III epsilon subunit family exonuclease